MNPILGYALDHAGMARLILARHHHVPGGDLEDVGQDVYLRILRGNPRHTNNTPAYWARAVHSAASVYWHHRPSAEPQDMGVWAGAAPEPLQAVCETGAARTLWRLLRESDREIVADSLRGEGNAIRLRRLRGRLERLAAFREPN